MKHSCGAPYHPKTQGNIERWHQTLKNCSLPDDFEAQIEAFVDCYNHQRQHESINQNTPADVCLAGRPFKIKKQFIDDIEGVTLQTAVEKLGKALLVVRTPMDATVGIESA